MAQETQSKTAPHPRTLSIHVGHEQIVIERIYEVASIVNDFMIGAWFLAGSILFFWEETTYDGTWLFVIGSAQLLIRPAIRLARHIHLRRGTPSYSQW
ncbi:hypothetical protein FHS78_002272 [Parvibaculum indicum]|uniref:YrhK family protein n=1 Tax=Parvibaculum indicum TaxID=562969 RepID=UPI00141D7AE3|nr:YrhK family protein [Parvibaculum indicum]NIJ41981.1 hypothetical protein [Parvibaculum indicum]